MSLSYCSSKETRRKVGFVHRKSRFAASAPNVFKTNKTLCCLSSSLMALAIFARTVFFIQMCTKQIGTIGWQKTNWLADFWRAFEGLGSVACQANFTWINFRSCPAFSQSRPCMPRLPGLQMLTQSWLVLPTNLFQANQFVCAHLNEKDGINFLFLGDFTVKAIT